LKQGAFESGLKSDLKSDGDKKRALLPVFADSFEKVF
jgi:hypothetical protein